MFIGFEISARRDERGKLYVRVAPAVIAHDERTERKAGGIAVALIAGLAFAILATYGLYATDVPPLQPHVTIHGAAMGAGH